MENKVFTTVLILVVAVLVGLSIVSRQEKSPLIHQLGQVQTEILATLKNIDAKMDHEKIGDGGGNTGLLVARMNTLEGRLAALEAKVKAGGAAPTPAPQMPPQPDPNTVYNIPVGDSHLIGPKNAKVTITEFIDFQCPFCARFHPPIEQVLKDYPKNVNLLLKNFPLSFHPHARPAAKAALAAAEQGKYHEMASLILDNNTHLGAETYKSLAKQIGLNVTKFENDLKNNDAKYEKIIQTDMQLGAKVNVRGTPTFYINGKMTNARDVSSWKAEIDKILKGSK